MTYQSISQTPLAATDEEAALGEEESEFRLILVGKSGGGKSATGNTILGRRLFESVLGVKTITLRCQRGQVTWQGRKISVVDTPGIFDSENYNEIVRREVISCVELSRPGPHALILVTQVGRFTAEDATAAKCVWDIFGAESARHTIVVFTCLEDLGGDPLQEYVRNSDNQNLRNLIRRCGNRFCGFNNKAVGAEQERQVSELMAKVQSVVFENRGRHYVNWLYREPVLRDEHVRIFIKQNRKPCRSLVNLLPHQFRLAILRRVYFVVRKVFVIVFGWFYPARLYRVPILRDEHVRIFIKQNRKPCRSLINLLLLPFRLACWVWRKVYSILRRVCSVVGKPFVIVFRWVFPARL